MERLDFAINETPAKTGRSKSRKKQKWREIEAWQEKQRLARELQELDLMHDYSEEDLEY